MLTIQFHGTHELEAVRLCFIFGFFDLYHSGWNTEETLSLRILEDAWDWWLRVFWT